MRFTSRLLPVARCIRGLILAAVILGSLSIANAASFTFATFTFEQDYTPNTLGLLGNGANLGGAVMSSGNVTTMTFSTAFVAATNISGTITPQAGFDPSLTLGRQGFAQQGLTEPDGSNCHYGCAINMPRLNDGTTTRHGINVSWSGYAGLLNGIGNDFVVYESATGTTEPGNHEAFMVRLALAGGLYTPWRYEFVDASQQYLGQPDSATATAFDLSDFGLLSNGLITAIQIANLVAADRVSGAGFGDVNFSGVGNTPLSSAGGVAFASGGRDPDPLYVGILGTLAPTVVPVPAAAWLLASALGGLAWARRMART